MEQINNITEEINNNNIDVTNKPKKEYKFTEKRKLAYGLLLYQFFHQIHNLRNLLKWMIQMMILLFLVSYELLWIFLILVVVEFFLLLSFFLYLL